MLDKNMEETVSDKSKIIAQDVRVLYSDKEALRNVNISISEKMVTAFIGPSGCGKSTFLRCFNRMNEIGDSARIKNGTILIDGVDIYADNVEITELRRRVGMVFQESNPFPKTIYENVAYGLHLVGVKKQSELNRIVENCLTATGLWEEVKDRLQASALSLSAGQQQRLCIARALAVKPDILLMDEPCSALDPIATGKIEELIDELKTDYTIVIVTHNMQQATRVSDRTAFFYLGKLIEYGENLNKRLVKVAEKEGFNLIASGMPSMPYYRLENVDFETHFRWIDECVRRGVYMLGYHNHFISLAHRNEDIDFIENTAKQAFQSL